MIFGLALAFTVAVAASAKADDTTGAWSRRAFGAILAAAYGVSVTGVVSGVTDVLSAIPGVV